MNAAKGDKAPVSGEYLAMFTALRTRWIDDAICMALRTDKQRMREGKTWRSIKQVVVLGCGGGAARNVLKKTIVCEKHHGVWRGSAARGDS